jgi:NAD(P)-dependent dehydrogenase (short-subunit alcohol dehydrogenase family)
MVNNAALMAEIPQLPVTDLPLDVWQRVLAVNVTGPLLCVRAVLPEMKRRGGGKIINQSSGGAFMAAGVYGVSKLALVSLTVTLARDLAPFKVNVNAIAPGFVETDAMLRCSPPEVTAFIRQTVPLKGVGQPTDLIGALLFLASSASDWVTGQTLNVDASDDDRRGGPSAAPHST